MKTDKVSVVFLHEHPEYLELCATFINSHWKRSLSARIQSLEGSYKDLPNSLLLFEEENGEKKLIGHSRVTRILEDDNGCWIESVLIAEDKRNKGYGKYLMIKTEEYAKRLNFSTTYLNTEDKQGFYEYLGYLYSEAVSPVKFRRNGIMKNAMLSIVKNNVKMMEQSKSNQSDKGVIRTETTISQPPHPPPPPPPLIPKSKSVQTNMMSNLGKYWMKKSLCCPYENGS